MDGDDAERRRLLADAAEEAAPATGTLVSSVSTLAQSAVGPGLLLWPFAFRWAGCVGGTFLALLYAACGALTLGTIVRAAEATHARSLQGVTRALLGSAWEARVSMVVVLYAFFAVVGCLIIAADVAAPLARVLAPSALRGVASGAHAGRTAVQCVAAAAAAPLCVLRSIHSLRLTAALAVGSVLYVGGMVMVKGAGGDPGAGAGAGAGTGAGRDGGAGGGLAAWPAGLRAAYAVPISCLAFQCHIQVVPIFTGCAPALRTAAGFRPVIAATMTLALALYVPTGVLGYRYFGRATPPNVLQDPDALSSSGTAAAAATAAAVGFDPHDPAVVVARLGFLVSVVLGIPINHYPARSAIRGLLRRCAPAAITAAAAASPELEPRDEPWRFRALEALAFITLALVVAVAVPDMAVLSDLLGATAGVSVIFLLPAAFEQARAQTSRSSCAATKGGGGGGDAAGRDEPGTAAATAAEPPSLALARGLAVAGVLTGLICAIDFVVKTFG